MIKKLVLLSLLFSTSATLIAQENTLESQFDDLIKKSNSYKEFKVVKKEKIYTLKESVLDTVAQLNQNIDTISEENKQQKAKISTLKNELKTTQINLRESKENEDAIKLFGVLTKKSTYKTIIFSIVGILLIIIFILYYKFKNSYTVTRSTTISLKENEEEFESFKQRSLEREQKLRRQLQDEINKSKEA